MAKQINENLVSWASILAKNAHDQAVLSATMPFIYPHIALMPDAHLGLGATVGSVIPTSKAIMPAAIGVDIGCGMSALRTNLTTTDLTSRDLANLRIAIERAVPVSAGGYNRVVLPDAKEKVRALEELAAERNVVPSDFGDTWKRQLGTLGGGNHFIEIVKDEEGFVWIFLHSGSRGVGNRIARKFIRSALETCEQKGTFLPHRDLVYFEEADPQFWQYMNHLRWAQRFAAENRDLMLERVFNTLKSWYRGAIEETERVLCHHNYTEEEMHFGETVWVSRKGAINAEKGRMGLIPGSMGTRSYVVRGKGDALSLNSAPHGAGRAHSRTAARKLFNLDDLRRRMRGIEYRDSAAFIDEIPDAYKPIDQVMEDAEDLVEVVHELSQLVNVKGN